ncbi:Polycystic kidney disease protein 1-like 2, partial [Lamellibrachia satsuma]
MTPLHQNNNVTVPPYDGMAYKVINITRASSVLMMDVTPVPGQSWQLYFKFNVSKPLVDRPTKDTYDFTQTVPSDSTNPWVITVPQNITKTGVAYVGISLAESSNKTTSRRKRSVAPQDTQSDLDLNFTVSLHWCRTWRPTQDQWSSDNCWVSSNSTPDFIQCECKNLHPNIKSHATGFTLPRVNTINFQNIFSNLGTLAANNPTVYSTVLVIIFVYLLVVVWARRMDKRDIERWGITPLLDNKACDRHCYKVSVFTGLRRDAGTTSSVCFTLAGGQGNTGMRLLDDGKNKHFTRGSVRHFLMTTSHSLKMLSLLRIWHDNSGDGVHAGWFLDKIVIEDLQTSERYFFLCGRWLASDEDDGRVDRNVPVVMNGSDVGFHNAFFTNARAKLSDDHIWFSVVMRPTQSSFTRVQ